MSASADGAAVLRCAGAMTAKFGEYPDVKAARPATLTEACADCETDKNDWARGTRLLLIWYVPIAMLVVSAWIGGRYLVVMWPTQTFTDPIERGTTRGGRITAWAGTGLISSSSVSSSQSNSFVEAQPQCPGPRRRSNSLLFLGQRSALRLQRTSAVAARRGIRRKDKLPYPPNRCLSVADARLLGSRSLCLDRMEWKGWRDHSNQRPGSPTA